MTTEVEHTYALFGACGDDVGEMQSCYQRGHVSPWELREHVRNEEADWSFDGWPRREWWREIPYDLKYPDEPPCEYGEPATLIEKCERTTPGAFAVTVVRRGEP